MTQGDPGVLVPLRLHRRLIAATVLGGALVLLAYATVTSTSPVETVAPAVPPIVVLVVP